MKLYKFDSNNECSIIKSEDSITTENLKALGYCETPQEAKESRVELINNKINNLTEHYKREVSDLSAKINFIKNF